MQPRELLKNKSCC